MRKISEEDKEYINADKFFKRCIRHKEGTCKGRITIDHVLTFGSKQIAELWNYIPVCEYHHGVEHYQDCGALDKEINKWAALNRATDLELMPYCKAINYIKMREQLNRKYGIFKQ